VSAGITEICVITSVQHMGDIVNLLGSGKEFGVNFTYKVQETAGGIAHALRLTEDFAKGEKIVVILGDNVATNSIKPFVQKFEKQEKGARVLLKKVDDPERYGVAAMDEQHIIEIQEKPLKPKTNYAVIGYYMYDSKVYDFVKQLKPSARGELEITDVNNMYIKLKEMEYDILEGEWTDAGIFESYRYANKILSDCNNKLVE
jgi:glucose-1-phosphate thymidylyltransferase